MPAEQTKKPRPTTETVDFEVVKDTYIDVKDEITDFVKKNPWASVAIAAGVGFLLGRLLSGRKE
jgi:ElaB/YqjD/DUF883 family membrane-anchored ribosome-binding protein